MLDAKLIHSLPQLSPPILTAYLDTNPAKPRNQRHPSGARIYLKSRGQLIGARAPREEQKLFREQLERIDHFLGTRPERERGVAIFAGPHVWHVLRLQVEVEDELHWGRPSLTQLLWLLDEHQPCGVAVVDRSGARFYRFWLGEVEEEKKERLELETAERLKKEAARPAHSGTQKTRGSQRDVFHQRIEAQYDKFFRDAASRAQDWASRVKLTPLILAGPSGTIEHVWDALPSKFQERVAVVKGEFSRLSEAELQDRLAPEVELWKRTHELTELERLLAGAGGTRAVAGLDETLLKLQQGAARSLVVVRGLGGKLRQCVNCLWADRSNDPSCSACGGDRRTVPLRAAIPELARRFGVHVEVVAGDAGSRLRAAGGLAAWLR